MTNENLTVFHRIGVRSKLEALLAMRPFFSAILTCFAVLVVLGYAMQADAQTAGTLDTTFGTGGKVISPINANLNTEQINDLAVQPDGKIIAGGFVNGNTETPPTSQDFGLKRYNSNGTLDTSFGNAGSVSLNFDLYLANPSSPTSTVGTLDNITQIALQPDGKILAAGFTYKTNAVAYDGISFAVARFNPNGSLDTTFGTDGKLKVSAGNAFDFGTSASLALQPDGKFVIAGTITIPNSPYVDLTVARFNANGSVDTSFGGFGYARIFPTQMNSMAIVNRIALQPDGKIVLVGKAEYNPGGNNHYGGVFVRYNADGSLDTSFGTNGILFYDSSVSRQLDFVTDVRIDPDGKIIAAGGGFIAGGKSILVRLNANSTFDTTFGTNGFVATVPMSATTALVRRQADGKYVLGGSDGNNNVNFTVARYNNNGSVDTTFQSFVSTDFFGGEDSVYAMLLQPDGKIVLGGSAFFQGGVHFALARYNAGSIVTRRSPFDFDGDSKTDLAIFRPGPGEWWVNKSSNGGNFALQFGASTDKLVPADFTGDGKTDVAFWRPSTGQWFVLRSEDFSFFAFPFGTTGDVPVPADYDGDGKSDAAVFRESSLTWYISKSSGGTDIIGFGIAADKPVIADYDGDGKADIAIFRPNGASGAEWWVRRSSNASVFALQFGASTDKAVPGDFTGDGKADVAFWRPSTGQWNVLRSEDFSYYAFPFGANGDVPVPGDYDGDGKTDAAVFRQPGAQWFVNKSTGGTLIQSFGIAGDLPLPNAFVR